MFAVGQKWLSHSDPIGREIIEVHPKYVIYQLNGDVIYDRSIEGFKRDIKEYGWYLDQPKVLDMSVLEDL